MLRSNKWNTICLFINFWQVLCVYLPLHGIYRDFPSPAVDQVLLTYLDDLESHAPWAHQDKRGERWKTRLSPSAQGRALLQSATGCNAEPARQMRTWTENQQNPWQGERVISTSKAAQERFTACFDSVFMEQWGCGEGCDRTEDDPRLPAKSIDYTIHGVCFSDVFCLKGVSFIHALVQRLLYWLDS